MIRRILFISLPLYFLYIGVGHFYFNKNLEDVLFLSIFYLIGLLLFSFIVSLFLSQKIEIKIIDYKYGKDGMPNMTPVGRGRVYTFTYLINSIEHRGTTFYSSMAGYKIGDTGIAYKNNKLIVLRSDLLKLLYFAIFPMIISIIFLSF
ncbi:hypothetical protein [Candidatus Sulfurimonas baltica]|uniref:Uncharacterized protein n=1 Tax=Candidatus Sulfurimonas baltica TaxID=2740404 RepID=A0A7S7RMA6_9BACT|nr:hypothetical protein [Candidatus Sulfurimonas baltica]QOY51972.1 hypothetical protein HUE88_12910 [Candidatus Sulfurimonas baltica]